MVGMASFSKGSTYLRLMQLLLRSESSGSSRSSKLFELSESLESSESCQ